MIEYTVEFNESLLKSLEKCLLNEESLLRLLDEYLSTYDKALTNTAQKKYFEALICGLLSNMERKTIEPIALKFLGEKAVRSCQQFMTRSTFDYGKMLDIYQMTSSELLNDKNSMICVDETDFVKKGSNSAGVARQYCGRLGKTENCQAGVFTAYSTKQGHCLINNELYIPEKWFTDEYAKNREKSAIGDNVHFKTKTEIALEMIHQAKNAGFKAKWVGCDSAFGCNHEFLDNLPEEFYYFSSVKSNEQVFMSMPEMITPKSGRGRKYKYPIPSIPPVTVNDIAHDESIPWRRVNLGCGTKGDIISRVKLIRVVNSRNEFTGAKASVRRVVPGHEVWLFIREYEDGSIKGYLTNAPADIHSSEIYAASRMRWLIEQCFQECKSNLGMDHYETQTLHAWKKHMLFVMIAHLFITNIRLTLKKTI